jgi:hypothetical protein
VENPTHIAKMVEDELQRITDPRLLRRIQELLVPPYAVERNWDYGVKGQRFTCWTILEHADSNTGVAYCSQGFGPNYALGLVFLSGPHMNIGMDCQWFASLEDAVRESMAWGEPNPPGYEVR